MKLRQIHTRGKKFFWGTNSAGLRVFSFRVLSQYPILFQVCTKWNFETKLHAPIAWQGDLTAKSTKQASCTALCKGLMGGLDGVVAPHLGKAWTLDECSVAVEKAEHYLSPPPYFVSKTPHPLQEKKNP